MSDVSSPVTTRDELVAYLESGEKPRSRYRVGTEHEKIGLRADDLRPVTYEGERGIGALLESIAREDDWTRVFEGPNLIALEKNGASITLEPGGQLELSGAPLETIHETCREFNAHLDLVRRVSEPLRLLWLSLGMNPLYTVEDIPVMPKSRYDIMRAYLPQQGELALEMMHLTATVQANFDYASEADMRTKMRTALAVSPIISAVFANSSIALGKSNGFATRRVHVWRHTDPERCGQLPFVFEEGFGYERYVDWVLDVPMFFISRRGRYDPANGMTFRAFLESGFDGEPPTLADFDLHLTTVFPEVRLKRILEVRGADAVPPDLICALPAVWKGILYDDAALASAWSLVRDLGSEDRELGQQDVARRGLGAEIAGRPVLALARDLVAIASEGLRNIAHHGLMDPDERGFLNPLHALLEDGRSPGERVLELWEGEWNRSVARLIDYARY